MSDELVKRLLDLADCDARAGEPLGRCMREAAARIEQLTAERDKWKTAFDESCNAWQQQCEYEMDRAEAAEAERDRLREDLEELDFLRHEGGPDSVAAIEAERDQLREALEQFLNEYDVVDLADAETSSMTAAVFAARGALHVNETPKSEHEAWDMLTPATKGGAL